MEGNEFRFFEKTIWSSLWRVRKPCWRKYHKIAYKRVCSAFWPKNDDMTVIIERLFGAGWEVTRKPGKPDSPLRTSYWPSPWSSFLLGNQSGWEKVGMKRWEGGEEEAENRRWFSGRSSESIHVFSVFGWKQERKVRSGMWLMKAEKKLCAERCWLFWSSFSWTWFEMGYPITRTIKTHNKIFWKLKGETFASWVFPRTMRNAR